MNCLHRCSYFNYETSSQLIFFQETTKNNVRATSETKEDSKANAEVNTKMTGRQLDSLALTVVDTEKIARGKVVVTDYLKDGKEGKRRAQKLYNDFFQLKGKDIVRKSPYHIRSAIVRFMGQFEDLKDLTRQEKIDAFKAACGSPKKGKVLAGFSRVFLNRLDWNTISEDLKTGKMGVINGQLYFATKAESGDLFVSGTPSSVESKKTHPKGEKSTASSPKTKEVARTHSEKINHAKGLITDLLTENGHGVDRAKRLYSKFYRFTESEEFERKSSYQIQVVVLKFLRKVKALDGLSDNEKMEAFRVACGSPKKGSVLAGFRRNFLDELGWGDIDEGLKAGTIDIRNGQIYLVGKSPT